VFLQYKKTISNKALTLGEMTFLTLSNTRPLVLVADELAQLGLVLLVELLEIEL
jgi:hypothetical protein